MSDEKPTDPKDATPEAQDDNAAAREAAQQAVDQAREMATETVQKLKTQEQPVLIYLGCMAIVVVFSLIFSMVSYDVSADHAVTEGAARDMREAESLLNAKWRYSIFSSTLWGKLGWVAALAGIVLVVRSVVTKKAEPWLPLALIGCAGLSALLILMLLATGFIDIAELGVYKKASSSATVMGYWIPLLAAIAGTVVSADRLFGFLPKPGRKGGEN